VLVGFDLGDIHHPFVLGGLWNGIDAPPEASDKNVQNGNVQRRIIRSRTGHTITLDDSDDSPGITIKDSQGNQIALDSKSNKLTIEIKGDLAITADQKLTLDAKANGSISGQGNLKLEASGEVTVKGSMVQLNP